MTTQDLKTQLRRFARELASDLPTLEPDEVTTRRPGRPLVGQGKVLPARPAGRRPGMLTAGVALAVGLLIGGGAWLFRPAKHAVAHPTACSITIPDEPFAPPEPYRPAPFGGGLVWYGSDELWTALSPDGEYLPRKSVWWSINFPGGEQEERPAISVTWARLDKAADRIGNDSIGTNAYTEEDGWFMIAGLDPDTPGCWEVTATYKGATLSYVYMRP